MAIYQGETKVANNYTIDNTVYCVPIGSIIPYASATLPKGFLLCNGAEVSKTDYTDLYAVIGDTFGTVTDNTKFKLPDLRDRFVQGANDNLGTNKEAGLPNITGELGYFNPLDNGDYFQGLNYGTGAFRDSITTDSTLEVNCAEIQHASIEGGKPSVADFNASKSNSIYGNSTTVQPPAVCLYYIIKATKLSDIPIDVSGVINDNDTGTDTTWSSNKINNQLQSVDATTLNGKNATNFAQNLPFWTGKDVKELLLAATSGFVFIRNDVTGMPIDNTYWFGIVDASSVHRCLTVHQIDGKYSGYCTYNSGSGKWCDWSNVASTVINDSTTTSKNETWSASKINSTLSMFPFKWKLIGTSEPETSGTSNKTFKQTMSGGNPFCVYHSSGVFCFGNGVPANRGKLYGTTIGQVASVDYSSAGELTVTVGSGKAYIYEMETITD